MCLGATVKTKYLLNRSRDALAHIIMSHDIYMNKSRDALDRRRDWRVLLCQRMGVAVLMLMENVYT